MRIDSSLWHVGFSLQLFLLTFAVTTKSLLVSIADVPLSGSQGIHHADILTLASEIAFGLPVSRTVREVISGFFP